MKPEQMTQTERAALERLIEHARGGTGQSRRVADFLLAWWNANECGTYDIASAWGVDDEIVEDMCVVFRLASRAKNYPDTLGYGPQFGEIVRVWRPELVESD